MLENQQPRIIIAPLRSIGKAMLLGLFLGPLGLFYTSVRAGFIMLFIFLFAIASKIGPLIFLSWIACSFWAAISMHHYNRFILKQFIQLPGDKKTEEKNA